MKFRVLSLSGGGMRGLYTASFLARLEELTGKRIVDHFDLIVGTSTGGLIAMAIALGQDVNTIRDFYAEKGELLFPKKRWRHGFWRSKHSIDALIREVKTRIGDTRTLGEAKKPLVLTTFDAVKGQPVCFKTRHHEEFRNDHRRPAWELAIATAAAPVYYGAFQAPGGGDYIDGGVWANCPVLVGVVEAIDRFDQPRTNIDVLSVGTTRCPFQVPRNVRRAGAWQYLSIRKRPLVNLMMEANRCAAMFMAGRLIGKDSIYEVDRDLPEGIALDDAGETARRELRDLGDEDAKDHVSAVEARFLAVQGMSWSPVP